MPFSFSTALSGRKVESQRYRPDMLDTLERLLLSQHPWSAVFYLFAGAVLGALISIYFTFKAQRPRLTISGEGGGGSQTAQTWNICISNQPSFWGIPFNGETAYELHAHVQLREKGSASYLLTWNGAPREHRATIEPGGQRLLDLFSWSAGTRGYCVLDQAGEPVARFESRELKFVLRFHDRLGRLTTFPFTVLFDDTHLKNSPQVQLQFPISMQTRWNMVKSAVGSLVRASGLRR